MARTRRQDMKLSAALSEIKRLQSETGRLEAACRQSLIERIIDLEIVAGMKQEKERNQESLSMMDSRKYPLEALEHLRKTMLVILSQRNHSPEASTDQKEPQRDYIK